MSDKNELGITLKPGQRLSAPIEGLTDDEVREYRAILEGYYRLKGEKSPVAKANTVLHCCIHAVRYDPRGNEYEWLNAPGLPADTPKQKLAKRVTVIAGVAFKRYMSTTPTIGTELLKGRKGKKDSEVGDILNADDSKKIDKLRKQYIDEFAFSTMADLSLLDRLVRMEVAIEKWENRAICGYEIDPKTSDSIKKITDTIISIQKTLGITAEQRNKVKAQTKEGTVADLMVRYRERKKNWPDYEIRYLREELHMLLNKYNRLKEDGTREITQSEFKRLTHGISVDEAYSILGKKNPDAPGS